MALTVKLLAECYRITPDVAARAPVMSFVLVRNTKRIIMKIKSVVATVVAIASSLPAVAGPKLGDGAIAQSGRTRAEVMADVEAYRASGLAELESRMYVDSNSPQYKKARSNYENFIASESFKKRVMVIAMERGEEISAANDASIHGK